MSLAEAFLISFAIDGQEEISAALSKVEDEASKFSEMMEKAANVNTVQVDKLPNKIGASTIKSKELKTGLEQAGKVKVEEGINKADKALDSANKKTKGFKGLLEEAKASGDKMGETILSKIKSWAAPAAAFAVVVGSVVSAVSRAGEINQIADLADQARMGAGDFDAMGRAAAAMGGSVEEAQSSLKSFAEKAIEGAAEADSEAGKIFSSMGIRMKDAQGNIRSTTDLIADFAGSVDKIGEVKARNNLQKLGITDPAMVKLILSGNKAMLERVQAQKNVNEITDRQVEISRKYKEAQIAFSEATKTAGSSLMEALLPALTTGMNALAKVIKALSENKRFAVIFFGAVAAAVTYIYAPAMWNAAAATIAATWPILALIAAAAAVALFLDDLFAYLNGEPSVLGETIIWITEQFVKLIEMFPWLLDVYNSFVAIITEGWAAITSLFNGDFGGFVEHFSNMFGKIAEFWGNLWEGFKGIVPEVMGWIVDKMASMLPGWARKWLFSNDDEKEMAKRKAEEEDSEKTDDKAPSANDKAQEAKKGTDDLVENKKKAEALVETAKTQVVSSSASTIPANQNKKIYVKKEINVNVASPQITINNTTDTEAAVAAAMAGLDHKMAKVLKNTASNADDGVAL